MGIVYSSGFSSLGFQTVGRSEGLFFGVGGNKIPLRLSLDAAASEQEEHVHPVVALPEE